MDTSFLLIYFSAFLFGLRHGIDWDHIAAITDLTASSQSKKSSAFFSTAYVIGHATVIIFLGLLAILLGVHLPESMDSMMEKFVGITLIALGIWILFSLLLHGKNTPFQSRGMFLFQLIATLYNKVHSKLLHKPDEHLHAPQKFGLKASYGIGIIHGIGAETPTQVLLFLTASGLEGGFTGVIFLLIFVVGLVISNSFITAISVFAYSLTNHARTFYVIFGIINALFSILVGVLFLTGRTSFLPSILGG